MPADINAAPSDKQGRRCSGLRAYRALKYPARCGQSSTGDSKREVSRRSMKPGPTAFQRDGAQARVRVSGHWLSMAISLYSLSAIKALK